MPCEICQKLEGDSTEIFENFTKIFEIIESGGNSMAELGTAKCKTCQQKIEFNYDEILIPKLRIKFI